ncbi:MAG TPA: hypothetical protein VF875_01025 [Anaeromyxobacter sp.]
MTSGSRGPRLLRRAAVAVAALVVVGALLAPAVAPAIEGLIFSGSVFVDQWGFPQEGDPSKSSAQGLAPMASMKVGGDVNDNLSFSAKACISCHGMDFEHISLDYQPRTWFNVQAGRIAVPFGDFSNRVDPTSYRAGSQPLIFDMGRMAYGSRSAMNLGVLPMPYVDTGAMVYGVRWLGSRIQGWYGAYGVSGLRGSNDIDWMAMHSAPYGDNNGKPSYGGRVTFSYASDAGDFIGDWSLGGSYLGGTYDKSGKLRYEVWGADATFRLSGLILRGEYASRKTDLDPAATGYPYALVDPFFTKSGFYAEAEHPLGKYLNVVYRYDWMDRRGTPLPGSPPQMTDQSLYKRYTIGAAITPAQNTVVKVSYEYWDTSDFGKFPTYHAGIGGAF